jgi:hypothetical protein
MRHPDWEPHYKAAMYLNWAPVAKGASSDCAS